MDISCICPTYARPHLLEESIESFLRQDFQGSKEMLILNDYDEQELIFDHPEVKVINTTERYNTLGEKYNAMFEMAEGKYLTPWEDDDIFLPHRLSYSYNRLEYFRADYHKLPWAFAFYDGKIKETVSNIFYCAGMWKRELALNCLCDAVNSNADQTIEKKLEERARDYRLEELVDKHDIYYCYMWGGRTYHLSGYGEGEQALLKAQADLRKSTIKGRIELNPIWRRDYKKTVEEYLCTQ